MNGLNDWKVLNANKIMPVAWIYLLLAAIFEIGWPVGFKLSQTTGFRILFIVVAVLAMGFSGFFLWMAQRDIPIGTAYAVWTGIGAAGTFLIGIVFFDDPSNLIRWLSFAFIVIGVVGLKIS